MRISWRRERPEHAVGRFHFLDDFPEYLLIFLESFEIVADAENGEFVARSRWFRLGGTLRWQGQVREPAERAKDAGRLVTWAALLHTQNIHKNSLAIPVQRGTITLE